MDSTPQHVYASNLLRRQSFGYPLRNPKPNDQFGLEGFRIGDLGYVDSYGEFNLVFNISSPPKELQDQILDFRLAEPVAKPAFPAKKVFMAGVERNPVDGRPRADYEFTTTETEGAILILPDGAILTELQDDGQLEQIREHAAKCARQWFRFTKRNSLYLVTAVYKSKSWTLGSFRGESRGKEILVYRQPSDSSNNSSSMYEWQYQINVDDQQGPKSNSYINQTVLIKGFKMTRQKGAFPIVEWAEGTEWWFARALAKLCSIMLRQRWLTRTTIDYIPFLNFSQPHHPLDIINDVLLEKNPGAQVAVTHDNDWINMLQRGLSPAVLMQEDPLREFMVREQVWNMDSNHHIVYLRNNFEDVNDQRERAQEPSSSRSDNSRLAIINMRLEGVDIDHIYAGVCVLVQFESTTRRTKNKPHATIVEWNDEIMLPSDAHFRVAICGVFQLGSTLGTREILTQQTIDIKDLSGSSHIIKFSAGKAKSCASLLITLGRHFSHFETHSSHEEKSNFVKKTDSGFDALYSYHDDPKKEYLERAVEIFQRALEHNVLDSTFHATALFNLATIKFIKCLAFGTYSELSLPIELYEVALKSRDSGNPDRPATLLLLAQALLSRFGQEYDESVATRIGYLLSEILPDNSRDRQTADVILRTRRFYRVVNARSPTEVDELLRDWDCGAYVPPYGFFDRPRMLHKLGVALWVRFQCYMDLSDLDKSIELNQEALHLVPDGHDDRKCIVACLGSSFLRRLEARGELSDVDMSADLVELGERVITALDAMTTRLAGMPSEIEELREQIGLMSAADTALQCITREVSSIHIPEVQGLVDEWRRDDSAPMRCKRQLGVLLSFLGGDGEVKMRALLQQLAEVDWPFKDFKTKETMEGLENYMPYFVCVFATRLRCLIDGWA